ncbi:GIY-YIG nuclease family protein [Erysipelothrix inopinata]|uniref:GIY-YIG nuclease family protein n=1 Tax=Erysipelothrix inopinata TaxID=225084 RepID=A0A7G9RYQ3_9FIRM|nr:GIY-YIG nuclease family protein [Erysipelothrix inopinata]QNN60728.1 GIY-YIG nuclease family protein [Erysipelothrix inopinata]
MDNKQHISSSYSITGVYVLFNETKNLVYVGQGKNVLSRVNSHFTGSGNGDVYADYKYGDEFKIKLVSLVSSGYASLNDLERAMINTYNSYERGYNRNRGNRR